MSVRSWLAGLLPNPAASAGWTAPVSRRFDSAPMPIDQMIFAMRNASGGRVGRADALSVPAVQKGRNLLCSISTLPLVQLNATNVRQDNPLFRQIDPDVPNVVTLSQTVEDLVFEAISWWEVTARDFDNFPTSARHVDISRVSLVPPSTMAGQSPLPSGQDPRESGVWLDGVKITDNSRLIRFDSPNPPVLACGRPIRKAILLDQTAGMYADNPRPLDYFDPTDPTMEIGDDEVRTFLAQWQSYRKAGSTGYVPGQYKYNSVDSPSPADLQLAELTKQTWLELANLLGCDPEDLGVSTTSRTYQNNVDRRRDKINDVLAPYMRAVTDRLSMGDVTRRGHTVQFDLSDYLKSNPTEQAAVDKAYIDMGVTDAEEVRAARGLPPRAAGTPEPAPQPDPAAASQAAAVLTRVFTAGDVVRFGAESTGFAVDREARTITGTLMPYNAWAEKYGTRFRFAKGSLKWADPSRVKLLRDHDPATAIGYAKTLKDSPAGLLAVFKVARGSAGDEALALAEDGVLDGLSAGTVFTDVDMVTDPKDKTAWLVTNAALREGSLTALPAFDDARVTQVNASHTNGRNAMPCTACGQVHAEGVAACSTPAPPAIQPTALPATFSAEQLTAMLSVMQAAMPVAPAPVLAPAAPERPSVVNPVRPTVGTFVADPAPYRFDRSGNLRPGSHEFSGDLISALRDNDIAAHQRALSFIQAQFDVVSTDVNELNPTRQRPDLYVDERSFRYPVWEAINKGSIADGVPFQFPKFSSASGLVAAHVEGTEPTSGTFVTTSDTVTPSGLSGKAKISRETWMSGGNPQIGTLIWNQMLKGWYEALEAAAVTVLDAASPTQIDFSGTPGLANDDLDQALTAAFASLQFVRGGFTMDNMFTQVDLYKALVAAVGQDGRRLYPALGPTNAGGTVGTRFGALDINGVTALPAWALAATGTVAASSYLFDSGSVHGWSTAPMRLTIDQTEVANVYIGLFGFKATVISDINGVREIVYDPS